MGEQALRASHTEQKFASAALSSEVSLELAGCKAFPALRARVLLAGDHADRARLALHRCERRHRPPIRTPQPPPTLDTMSGAGTRDVDPENCAHRLRGRPCDAARPGGCEGKAAQSPPHCSRWRRDALESNRMAQQGVLSGLWPPVATPFSSTGSVDHQRLVALGRRLLNEGARGLVILGTTGEATSLGLNERHAVIDAVAGGIDAQRLI